MKGNMRSRSKLVELTRLTWLLRLGLFHSGKEISRKVFGEEEGRGVHIVGMHAHAAQHRHNHASGQEGCETQVRENLDVSPSHMHSHLHGFDDEDESGIRHVVVSQVLELVIIITFYYDWIITWSFTNPVNN